MLTVVHIVMLTDGNAHRVSKKNLIFTPLYTMLYKKEALYRKVLIGMSYGGYLLAVKFIFIDLQAFVL